MRRSWGPAGYPAADHREGVAARVGAADSKGRDDTGAVGVTTEAQRRRLVALRADGTIGDAAFHRVEEERDWTELGWAQVVGAGEATHGAR